MKTYLGRFLAVTLFGIAASSVFAASTGMQHLRIIQTTEPQFPPIFQMDTLTSGESRIVIDVDADGKLTDCLVASYTHPAFADEAVTALKSWRYEPARLNGEPVGVRTEIAFSFYATGKVVSLTAGEALISQMKNLIGEPLVERVCRPHQLDRLPQVVQTVTPRAPGMPGQPERAPGAVLIDFFIDETGRPRMPVVLQAADDLQAGAAVEALSQWRFTAPLREGKPVAVRAQQAFVFKKRT